MFVMSGYFDKHRNTWGNLVWIVMLYICYILGVDKFEKMWRIPVRTQVIHKL